MSSSDYVERLGSLTLDTKVVGTEIRPFDEIDSTNEWALEHGVEGLVAVADRQTAGRGRQGRAWLSEPGLGLWFTVCFDGILQGLSFAAALSVRDAIPAGTAATVKWPNDILIRGKKVCGILTEHRGGKTALGIGVNVHHRPEHFPIELRDVAGSIESETGSSVDRSEVLTAILLGLDARVILLRSGGYDAIRDEWADACALIGRRIQRDSITGVVTAIDAEGALILDTPAGERRFLSGDVTILDGV